MVRGKGKILVVRGGAVGDFILTLPVFSALREHFPETRLEVLGYPQMAGLALAGGLVDGWRSIEARPLASYFARKGPLDSDLAQYFASFSVIISYLYDPDQHFGDNVRGVSKAQYIQAIHRPSDTGGVHASSALLQALRKLAIFEASPVAALRLPSDGHQLDPAHPWIALHPGSGSESKNWPEERWAALLHQIALNTRLNLLLVGGEAEMAKVQRLAREFPPSRCLLAAGLELHLVGKLMAQTRAFLGHDSGVTHLASALGLPCLVLWGPTVREVWAPLGEKVSILQHPEGLPALPPGRVFEELERMLG